MPYRKLSLRGAFVSGALAFALAPQATSAQGINLGNIPLPPQNPSIDENGVDIVTGHVSHEITELAIGGDGLGALSLIKYYNTVGGFRTNFDNQFDEDITFALPQIFMSANVVFGTSSEHFYGTSAFQFGPTRPTGSTYEDIGTGLYDAAYIYRKKDGTYISFTRASYKTPSDFEGSTRARALSDYVQYRNGVRWTYHYQAADMSSGNTSGILHRVQSITSNTGYQIKFYYASDTLPTPPANGSEIQLWMKAIKAVAINNAYDYCNPTANECTTSLQWPKVIYDFYPNSSPGYYLTVTKPNGEITDYDQNGSMRESGNSSRNKLYQFQVVNIICVSSGVTYYCPDNKVSSATVNGATTTYSYNVSSGSVSSNKHGALNTYFHYENIERIEPTSNDITGINFSPVIKHTDPLGRVSNYEYQTGFAGAFGGVTKAILPEGNYFEYTRDGKGLVTKTLARAKVGSSLPDVVENRVLNAFGQPTSITDPRNNVTTYTCPPSAPMAQI